jgi:GGDEF domain-containing protein
MRGAVAAVGGLLFRVTVSAGVADARANRARPAEEVLTQADAALYGAKRQGSHRAVVFATATAA